MRVVKSDELFEYTSVPLEDAQLLDLSDLNVRVLQGDKGFSYCTSLETLFLNNNKLDSLCVRNSHARGNQDSTGNPARQSTRHEDELESRFASNPLVVPAPPDSLLATSQVLDQKETNDFLSHYLKQLWKLDASGNQTLRDLGGLRRFKVLGFLNLKGCNLNYAMLSELHTLHIAYLDIQDNPRLREGHTVSEYRKRVVSLLPNVWVLDGELVTFDERQDAAQMTVTGGLGPELEALLMDARDKSEQQWYGARKLNSKAHWFLHELIPAEPRQNAECSDRYRTQALRKIYADQHAVESHYQLPNTRSPLPLSMSCQYMSQRELNELVSKQLDMDEKLEVISLLVATSWKTWPKCLFQRCIDLVCGPSKSRKGLLHALEWPRFCRLVLVDALVAACISHSTVADVAPEEISMLKQTNSALLRRLHSEDGALLHSKAILAWNARSYILLAVSQGTRVKGVVPVPHLRQEWYRDLNSNVPDYDKLFHTMSSTFAKSKASMRVSIPTVWQSKERETLIQLARSCWSTPCCPSRPMSLLAPIGTRVMDANPVHVASTMKRRYRSTWRPGGQTFTKGVFWDEDGGAELGNPIIIQSLQRGKVPGPLPSFKLPITTKPIEAITGIVAIAKKRQHDNRIQHARNLPQQKCFQRMKATTLVVEKPGPVRVTQHLSHSKIEPLPLTSKALGTHKVANKRLRKHLAASRKW